MPIPIPASREIISIPLSGLIPKRAAPVAPLNPICAKACAAKLTLRITTKYPTTAPNTPTREPAIRALRTKSYEKYSSKSLSMTNSLCYVSFRANDKDPSHCMDDVNFRAVEGAQHLAGKHLIDGT